MMDLEWHRLMLQIQREGELRMDRTGVGTRAIFGARCEWDLRECFPACTTKKLYFGQVRAELAAFLAGAESLEDFHQHGCDIWDKNAKDWRTPRYPGDVGRIYGVQWRRWRSVFNAPSDWEKLDGAMHEARAASAEREWRETDQIAKLVEGIRAQPHGRRHLVQTWNPGELDAMCLPPCHVLFQCFTSDGVSTGPDWLDLHFHMRSLDVFLGMPFDVASYGLMAHLVARAVGREPRRLIMTSGDTHLYLNHTEQVEKVLSREPLPGPRLVLMDGASVLNFDSSHAYLAEYEHHPAVYAPMNN